MSETHDPWAEVDRQMEALAAWSRTPPATFDELAQPIIGLVVAVNAARAAEATQHQEEIKRWELARDRAMDERDAVIRDAQKLRAERDRLKAALSQITALDFEKVNGRHNLYSGAAMFVKAWLLAYAALSGEGTAKP